MDFSGIKFKGTFRKYQKRVLDASNLYLSDKRINVVAAPGSGKTILGLELIRRLSKPCLILSPTTTIREQWADRFKDFFLTEEQNVNDYVSNNLNNITLINSITYQALYSAMERISASNDEEKIDYSNIDLFKLIKKNKIKTICLDEAHHLQNKWQKALEKFIKGLSSDVKIISLTATPPYDATKSEWDRYIQVCGEIDEEIFVPELVKEGNLCPHQDYVIFNYPTKNEENCFKEYKEKSFFVLNEISKFNFIAKLNNYINSSFDIMNKLIYSNVKEFTSVLTLFKYYNFPINKKLIKNLTGSAQLPSLDLSISERALQFLIDSELLTDDNKNELIELLKKYSLFSQNKVSLNLNYKLEKKLISSLGKMSSIIRIVESEHSSLKENLRMLILTDYIKKDSLLKVGSDNQLENVSVVSIFETIRRNFSLNVGALSGSLVILPNDVLNKIKDDYVFEFSNINNTTYSTVDFKGTNKDKVKIVSSLFEKGLISILVGTKSLLGEGWDSPCINSLILASFVGSFMLSNQMRGRAIRSTKSDPNKVSNIFHLVTLEPKYIYKDEKLTVISEQMSNSKTKIDSADFTSLERRFQCFVGPRYDNYEIESGIKRLSIIKPPYNKENIDRINNESLELSKNRELTREKWDKTLINSDKMCVEVNIPKDRSKTSLTYSHISKLITIIAIYFFIFIYCYSKIDELTLLSFVGFSSLLLLIISTISFLLTLPFAIRKLLSNSTSTNQIKSFTRCILKVLKEIGKVNHSTSLKISNKKNYISVYLNKASIHEQNVFNTAIAEFFNPIDNPRYIVVKKGTLAKYSYKYSYACPTIIGKNKENAELFKNHLSKLMDNYCLVYTKNKKGEAILAKCKEKSYITLNSELVNNKHKLYKN